MKVVKRTAQKIQLGKKYFNEISILFQNFVETSRTQKYVNEIKIDKNIELSQIEKEKIKARSNIMAKQFFPGTFLTLI
jgi:hypothetical protein